MVPTRHFVSLALGVVLAGASLRLAACSVVAVPPDPPQGSDPSCITPGDPDGGMGGAGGGAGATDAGCSSTPIQ